MCCELQRNVCNTNQDNKTSYPIRVRKINQSKAAIQR